MYAFINKKVCISSIINHGELEVLKERIEIQT